MMLLNNRVLANGLQFIVLIAIPLIAELMTTPSNYGFDILLYEPFDFAYILLSGFLFIALNIFFSKQKQSSILIGVSIGTIIFVVWFVLAFLAVAQLHLSLGGKL